MDRVHPEEPVRHLAIVATDPAREGKGLGSALMAECLWRCEADGRAAHLGSTNPATLSLHHRHGFEQIGAIEADGAPRLFPMLRPAAR